MYLKNPPPNAPPVRSSDLSEYETENLRRLHRHKCLRRIQTRAVGGVAATAIIAYFLALPHIWITLALGMFTCLLIAALLSELGEPLVCPHCHNTLGRLVGKYCPSCASTSLHRTQGGNRVECESCGKRVFVSGEDAGHSARACTHCGLILEPPAKAPPVDP